MSVEVTNSVPAGADRDGADAARLAAALTEQRAITEKAVWQAYELQAAGSRRQAAVERLERRLRDTADTVLAGKEAVREALLAAERLRGELAAAEARIAALKAERTRAEAMVERAGATIEDRTRKLAMLQERLTAMMADKASRAVSLERQIKIADQLNARIAEAEGRAIDLVATVRERDADLARQNRKTDLLTSNLAIARATGDMLFVQTRILEAENRRLALRAERIGQELEFRRVQIAERDAAERERAAHPSLGRRLADWWHRTTSATPPLDPRLAAAGVSAEDIEAIEASGYFDREWYGWQYREDGRSREGLVDLLTHDGTPRNPGPLFDAAAYRADAGEAADGVHPLLHYVRSGRAAGVQVRPVSIDALAAQPAIAPVPVDGSDNALLAGHPLFDAAWYLAAYADVAAAGVDPIAHYIESGAAEGRDPGPYFSTNAYNQRYRDVSDNGMNPLVHFLRFGLREGRLIDPAAA